MDKLELTIQKIKQECKDPKIETTINGNNKWHSIIWSDESNDECFIFENNIAIHDNKIAWFQSSKNDRHLLKVYSQDKVFSWTPKTYNPAFGCYCLLLEWYKEYLIFIYQEKHGIYICSIKDENVNYFYFHGEEIERKGDLISYETYQFKSYDKIKLIKIPELIELEPIDRTEAEKLGLIPEGLNRPGNFLGFK